MSKLIQLVKMECERANISNPMKHKIFLIFFFMLWPYIFSFI